MKKLKKEEKEKKIYNMDLKEVKYLAKPIIKIKQKPSKFDYQWTRRHGLKIVKFKSGGYGVFRRKKKRRR